MKNFGNKQIILRSVMVASAIVMGLTLSTNAMAGKKTDKSRETCSSMGAPYGSPGHTDCMLQQQQRGDEKMLNFLAEQRMHQELGREARETLQRKRERRDREQYCR